MPRPRPLWARREDWLPAFEVANWPRLAEHRTRHEDALQGLRDAEEVGDEHDREAMLLSLCDVVEAAVADLRSHLEEGAEALRAAAETATPPPLDGSATATAGSPDEHNRLAEEANRARTQEQARLRVRRRAVQRDGMALGRVQRLCEASVLHANDFKPQATAEVEIERARIGEAAEAGPTLEERLAQVEEQLRAQRPAETAPPAPEPAAAEGEQPTAEAARAA